MITEDYCSYEVSKLLEEKEFPINEHLFMYVNKDGKLMTDHQACLTLTNEEYRAFFDDYVPTITHQMAMKWLRDIYDIHISVGKAFLINDIDNKPYFVQVCTKKCHTSYNTWSEYHSTYEEAVEAALKHSLKNLI